MYSLPLDMQQKNKFARVFFYIFEYNIVNF